MSEAVGGTERRRCRSAGASLARAGGSVSRAVIEVSPARLGTGHAFTRRWLGLAKSLLG